jgi:NAD(P)-dependent dehydrogenase (short-subunit alcohol dehydrogenase family)
MKIDLRGKVAVVTGAGGGLGAAFTRELAARGARAVIGVDLRFNELAIAGVEQVHLDVTDSAALGALLDQVRLQHGSLDLIINNAGISVDGEPLDIPDSAWERVIAVNLLGVVRGSLGALRIMKPQGRGIILNMGSMTALALTPLLGPYSSSKAAVVTFSRSLAEEARGFGVQVSVACPGNIATGILPAHVSGLMKPMPAAYAARRILDAAASGRRIIVFPLYARLWWWMDRLSPQLLAPLRQVIVKRSRARAAAAKTTGAP